MSGNNSRYSPENSEHLSPYDGGETGKKMVNDGWEKASVV